MQDSLSKATLVGDDRVSDPKNDHVRTTPDPHTPQAKRYRNDDGNLPTNPHMRSLAQNTMLQKVRIEVRASDLHIFIVSDPVRVG